MKKRYVEALVQPIIATIVVIILMLITNYFSATNFKIENFCVFAIGTFIGNYFIALFIQITKN